MPTTLMIFDETASGERSGSRKLNFLTERITVRELIRARIYQEVQDHNVAADEVFRGLVQPSDAERTLNGFRMKKARKIDWEEQFKRALEGFDRNAFFLLIGDRQAEGLDEEVVIGPETEVSFVKLVPLVGG